MRIQILPILLILFGVQMGFAQTNSLLTHPQGLEVLKGNYSPSSFYSNAEPAKKTDLINGLYQRINSDSLMQLLLGLERFNNRNTGSDTVSMTNGIGAARRWAHDQFVRSNQTPGSPLLCGYFQFDKILCSVNQHRNVVAILPGTDTSLKDIIILEAHLDSRCESVCDTACLAQGMEDNGSGCALVMELARVMRQFQYRRTIVFMLTIAEEQGLDGADAFAKYCKANGIQIRAVLNNDVIGGVICGKTSSPPSCPGENEIDSIQVRIFSAGANYSPHKGLARFTKLEFIEEMLNLMPIKQQVTIMNAEDRTGRGGDHIPFRQQGYPAIRFTSANEHGDANPQAGYQDRQHSTRDVLGKDLNSDGILDSLYVNTTYLRRNALLNGTSAAMAANGPVNPDFDLINDGNGLSVVVKNPTLPYSYRIGFRGRGNDFDTLFTLNGTNDLKTYHVKQDSFYFVSVARVDNEGIESTFNLEKYVKVLGVPPAGLQANFNDPKNSHVQLLPAFPNPADETMTITVYSPNPAAGKWGRLQITDLTGRIMLEEKMHFNQEMQEVIFHHGFHAKGIYLCTLFEGDEPTSQQKIVFK